MKSDVLTLITGADSTKRNQTTESRTERRRQDRPDSVDDLADIARDVLMDKQLEVSKVRPFFWSLVETYADRFQSLPFDPFKALFSHLEMRDFPAEEMEEVIRKLEKAYQERHGKPLIKRPEIPSEYETLDDEIRDLKDSLCYASLVGEDLDEIE